MVIALSDLTVATTTTTAIEQTPHESASSCIYKGMFISLLLVHHSPLRRTQTSLMADFIENIWKGRHARGVDVLKRIAGQRAGMVVDGVCG